MIKLTEADRRDLKATLSKRTAAVKKLPPPNCSTEERAAMRKEYERIREERGGLEIPMSPAELHIRMDERKRNNPGS
jgi:hypothetical protein